MRTLEELSLMTLAELDEEIVMLQEAAHNITQQKQMKIASVIWLQEEIARERQSVER